MGREPEATLAADIADFGRLTDEDRDVAIAVWRDFDRTFNRHMERHRGAQLAVVLEASYLAEFPSALEALGCAVALQRDLSARRRSDAAWRRAGVRIGVNDNVRSCDGRPSPEAVEYHTYRLLELSPPGGVCISRIVCSDVRSQLDLRGGAMRDSGDSAALCRDIGLIWNDLPPPDSPFVRISAEALTATPGRNGGGAAHRIRGFFGRMLR